MTGSQVNCIKVQALDGDSSSYPEHSGIADYANHGEWTSGTGKDNAERYVVKTVALNDLLQLFNTPKEIGSLSINTEGFSKIFPRGTTGRF